MTYVDGDIVLIEHPFMREEFVIAKVVGSPTKAMCKVRPFTYRGWSEETNGRKLSAIKGKIADTDNLDAVRNRLRSSAERHREAERQALAQHLKRVLKEIEPKPPVQE